MFYYDSISIESARELIYGHVAVMTRAKFTRASPDMVIYSHMHQHALYCIECTLNTIEFE